MTNDTAFQEYVKEYFYLDADRDKDDLSYEDDSSYFSDDDINESEMEEIDNTFFDEHFMDDVSEDILLCLDENAIVEQFLCSVKNAIVFYLELY